MPYNNSSFVFSLIDAIRLGWFFLTKNYMIIFFTNSVRNTIKVTLLLQTFIKMSSKLKSFCSIWYASNIYDFITYKILQWYRGCITFGRVYKKCRNLLQQSMVQQTNYGKLLASKLCFSHFRQFYTMRCQDHTTLHINIKTYHRD